MKPRIAFTIADRNNERFLKQFVNSLRKFHSEEELPLKIVEQKELDSINDLMKFYRMTPMIARTLIDDYETVIKFDCDQIVTGKLNALWENNPFDVSCVLNSNPREPIINLWDIHPAMYMNCGLVVMKSKRFINHWWKLCTSPHFNSYQYREQDLLNILYHYGDYEVRCLDHSNSWWGLVSKGWYGNVVKAEDELILKKEKNEWPMDGDKTIKVIHFAGGNDPQKGNYHTMFKPEVAKYIDFLVSDGK